MDKTSPYHPDSRFHNCNESEETYFDIKPNQTRMNPLYTTYETVTSKDNRQDVKKAKIAMNSGPYGRNSRHHSHRQFSCCPPTRRPSIE